MQRAPWATWLLAGLILLVAWRVTGWVPTDASLTPVAWSREAWQAQDWGRLAASVFAHGGLLHLGMNLLALLTLGPVLERIVGPGRFLAVYLGAGLAGNLVHAMGGASPVVGASGALFGLIGLVAVLEPRAELAVFFPLPMSAALAGAAYAASVPFLLQLTMLPIAHLAHLGGMAFGMAAALAVRPARAARTLPAVLGVFGLVWLAALQAAELAPRVLRGPPLAQAEWAQQAFAAALLLAGLALAFAYLRRLDAAARRDASAPAAAEP